MTVAIRRATEADVEQIHALDRRNFAVSAKPTEDELQNSELELDRFIVATDGDDLVAVAGSFAMELTVATGPAEPAATVPMSGVTWVSVAASHRRQGILRRLMGALDEMAAELEEPALGLTASEGAIYERFGYGITTRIRVVELDRRRAQIDAKWNPEPVRLIDATDHLDELRSIYDRYRLTQPGEVSRSEALFKAQSIKKNEYNFAAIHPDGYAVWGIESEWNNGHPAHVLTVRDLVAVTPEANLALWNILLSVDLVGPIRAIRSIAWDDPLPYFLTDPRALRTVEANDNLWLKITDPVTCFQARTYRTDDRLVIGIRDDGQSPGIGGTSDPSAGDPSTGDRAATVAVERVAISAKGCEPTDEPPDIIADRGALGPILAGVNPSQLAAGRRLVADPETLIRADLMFGTGRVPHTRTPF